MIFSILVDQHLELTPWIPKSYCVKDFLGPHFTYVFKIMKFLKLQPDSTNQWSSLINFSHIWNIWGFMWFTCTLVYVTLKQAGLISRLSLRDTCILFVLLITVNPFISYHILKCRMLKTVAFYNEFFIWIKACVCVCVSVSSY